MCYMCDFVIRDQIQIVLSNIHLPLPISQMSYLSFTFTMQGFCCISQVRNRCWIGLLSNEKLYLLLEVGTVVCVNICIRELCCEPRETRWWHGKMEQTPRVTGTDWFQSDLTQLVWYDNDTIWGATKTYVDFVLCENTSNSCTANHSTNCRMRHNMRPDLIRATHFYMYFIIYLYQSPKP